MEDGHTHKWKSVLHMDGCHTYSNHYSCTCGADRVIGGERLFRERGKSTMSSIWALETCERCQALLNGARRKPRYDVTIMPDGTEIKNKANRRPHG